MSDVFFKVYGDPKGKGRPKFSKVGNFARAYTPPETENYEAFIKMTALDAAKGAYLHGAIEAKIDCIYKIPISWSKRKRKEALEGIVQCTKKPDADNIAKTMLDSLNGIIFDDDRQVTVLTVRKFYGETPRVEVTLSEIEQ